MDRLKFVVPAYGESPFLKECLTSLCKQSIDCDIAVSTSTPNELIFRVAKQHAVPVIQHNTGGAIGLDWNFALHSQGHGCIVLAHQDDIYHPMFAESCIDFYTRNPDVAIAFTDSSEIIDQTIVNYNKRELVKWLLRNMAFMGGNVVSSRFQYRRLLGFGCSIPCPSVSFNLKLIPDFQFSDNYTANLDWDAWTRITEEGHKIGYIKGRYVLHRIHAGAETQKRLKDNRRALEDLDLFCRYWPKPVASILSRLYQLGY